MARFAPLFVLIGLVLSTQALAEPNHERAGVLSICRGGTDATVAKAQTWRGEAAVKAASVLPNPALVLEHQHTLSGPVERETMVALSVPLGLGGRRGVLQQAAEARRGQALAEARASLFEATLEFREAYALAVVERARAQVLEENQRLLDSLTAVIQKLERAGESAAYDKLRQEAQARVHRQRLRIASVRAVSAQQQLRAWLGRDVAIGEPDSFVVAAGGAAPRGAAPPMVDVLQADARANDVEARAAGRRAVPDVSLLAGYRTVAAGNETGHGIALGLELPLTLFDRGQGETSRAEADARLLRSLADRHKRRNEATLRAALTRLGELRATLSEAQAAVGDVALVREKAVQLYGAGEASLTELLEACRDAEEAQLMRLDLVQEIASTRVAVMRASGTQLDAELDRECRDGEGRTGR